MYPFTVGGGERCYSGRHKMLTLYLLARVWNKKFERGMQFASVLSRGEFALCSFLPPLQRLPGDQMALLVATVTLSMMTTPLLMQRIDMVIAPPLTARKKFGAEKPWVEDDKPVYRHVCRFGQVIALAFY
ncbi:hypothetical protein KCP76_07485 [Salmonella enterica subsp. enterica serovar Weltevreden]|nr:hypothetical protein KCP76_07485 [Salmonella enterica subsp. enterica serovar Weltevreden]